MKQQTLTTRPSTYAGLTISAQLAIVKESDGRKAQSPEHVSEICEDLRDMAQEAFVVITLDQKNEVIARNLITLGILNASLVHPREVFRSAMLDSAAAIILVHNHPSGDPSPSSEDIKITRQLIEAGKILDICVHDHVIIGRGNTPFFSIRESQLCTF